MQKCQRIESQKRNQTPVASRPEIQCIRHERARLVTVINRRHEDILHDVQQDVRWKEGAGCNVEAVAELESFGLGGCGGGEEACLAAPAGEASYTRPKEAADEEVEEGANQKGAKEEVDEDEGEGELEDAG